MSEQPGRHSDQFNLRLPDGMRDRLKAEAEANKRSMNAEIVARLEASLRNAPIQASDMDALHSLAENVDPSVMTRDEWQKRFDEFAVSFRHIAVNMEGLAHKVRKHFDEDDKK